MLFTIASLLSLCSHGWVVLKQGDSGDEIDSPWLHLSRFQLDNTMSISPNDIVLVISHHLPYSNTAHGWITLFAYHGICSFINYI